MDIKELAYLYWLGFTRSVFFNLVVVRILMATGESIGAALAVCCGGSLWCHSCGECGFKALGAANKELFWWRSLLLDRRGIGFWLSEREELGCGLWLRFDDSLWRVGLVLAHLHTMLSIFQIGWAHELGCRTLKPSIPWTEPVVMPRIEWIWLDSGHTWVDLGLRCVTAIRIMVWESPSVIVSLFAELCLIQIDRPPCWARHLTLRVLWVKLVDMHFTFIWQLFLIYLTYRQKPPIYT